jgi:prepilin-type N-terminal cleavage/methylation domain-containing protein/prepilin-type processing-associated H-X9-DG protein
MRKKSFTLIELLVVIAIISILASMLLPALKKARASAMTADCSSKVKQISQGLIMYADDNGGWYPPLLVGGWAYGYGTSCFTHINGYVFGKEDPDLKAAYDFYSCAADVSEGSQNNRCCYGVNAHGYYSSSRDGIWLTSAGDSYEWGPPSKTTQIPDSSGTFLSACYANTISYTTKYDYYLHLGMQAPYHESLDHWDMGFLHNKATNWGFCDGHVEWMPWQQSVGTGTAARPKGIWTKTAGD